MNKTSVVLDGQDTTDEKICYMCPLCWLIIYAKNPDEAKQIHDLQRDHEFKKQHIVDCNY